MLKQPGPQDVRRNLRENPSFLLIFFTVGVVVLLTGAIPAANAGITRLTCNTKESLLHDITLGGFATACITAT